MSFKLFFKYILLLQLLLISSLSFGNDPAIYINSSSRSNNCIENLNINVPLKGEVKCEKNDGGQNLVLSLTTVWSNAPVEPKKFYVPIHPYVSNGETIGGITDISGDQTIYAASLHMFLKPWDNKDELFKSYLQNTIPILVSTSPNHSQYFDLILFVKQSLFSKTLSTLPREERTNFIRDAITSKINLNFQPSDMPGLKWISPNQFSKIADTPSIADSHGTIAQLVHQTLNNQSYSEFYLSNESSNFSTAGSSGSVIFDSESHIPLGLLQCQMTQNLIVNDVEQNTNGLYKIINFNILKEFNLQLIDINQLTQNLKHDSIKTDFNCSWRDGKGGG